MFFYDTLYPMFLAFTLVGKQFSFRHCFRPRHAQIQSTRHPEQLGPWREAHSNLFVATVPSQRTRQFYYNGGVSLFSGLRKVTLPGWAELTP